VRLSITVRRWIIATAALLGAAGTLGLSAGTVLAHAELISSSPANQAVLATKPSEILLTFSENVDPVGDAIRLVDSDGDPVPLGPIDQSQGGNTMRAPVPAAVADGTYVVGWQAISADSHKVRGAYTFSIGAATATAPGVIETVFDSNGTNGSDSTLLALGRFLSYAGIGVLLGALFLAVVLVPELLGERRIGMLLIGAAITALVGTMSMFAGQAHVMSGSYTSWGDVVRIQSGTWWLGRLVAIGVVALFIPARTFLGSKVGRVEVAVAALVLLGVVAAGGHAVSGDHVVVGFVATVVHLAAMSIWLGGLVLLVAGVPREWFWWTASKFSPWALGAVVALVVTGTVNAWRQVGSISALPDSNYGRWLIVKVVLVALVVAVAVFSRRLARSDDVDSAETDLDESMPIDADTVAERPAQEAPRALRRAVAVEVVGMALILIATTGLVSSPPPPSAATTQSASAVVGERIAQVELQPAVTEGGEMHIYLSSPSGSLDSADEITVTASLPSADLGPLDIETVPAGPNHAIGPDVSLPVAGLWTFDVTARYGEFDEVVFSVQIPVSR
jgi:copper transport protein